MSLFSMSLLSPSDKAVQSAMTRSITWLQPGRKSPEIQIVSHFEFLLRDPALLGTTIRTSGGGCMYINKISNNQM